MGSSHSFTARRFVAAVSFALSASPVAAQTIVLTEKPELQRVRNESSVRLPEYLRVRASVRVEDKGVPVTSERVVFMARSGAGVFKSGTASTDRHGVAATWIRFDVPPGSLRISIQACLVARPEVCTRLNWQTLRDWADVDLTLTMGYGVRPLSEVYLASDYTARNAIADFSVKATPHFQLNAFEAERQWRYYRISAFAEIPFVARNAGSAFAFGPALASYDPVESAVGAGDLTAGLDFALGGSVFGRLAYNARTGKPNRLDVLRGVADQQGLYIGEGFNSIDTFVEARKAVGGAGHFVFVGGSSRQYQPRIEATTAFRAGPSQGVFGGLGLRQGNFAAVEIWVGYYHSGSVAASGLGPGSVLASSSGQLTYGIERVALVRSQTRLSLAFGSHTTASGFANLGASMTLTLSPF